MSGSYAVFEIFNWFEAFIWFGIAIYVPFSIRSSSKRQKACVAAASFGFVAFGITDLLEAPTHGNVPIYLWILKIGCVAFLLLCRFHFIGWKKFRFTDRYFILGFLGLAISVAIFAFSLPVAP